MDTGWHFNILLRGLVAGSHFIPCLTAFAAEQTVEAPSVDARAWILPDYASVRWQKAMRMRNWIPRA